MTLACDFSFVLARCSMDSQFGPEFFAELGFIFVVSVLLIILIAIGFRLASVVTDNHDKVLKLVTDNHEKLYNLVKRVRFTANDQHRFIFDDGSYEDV